jgi:hypothetical protein
MAEVNAPAMRSRTNELVAWLQSEMQKAGELDKTRVKNLVAMIRRNGLLLTMTYLSGKGGDSGSDKQLCKLLAAAVPRALGAGPQPLSLGELCGLDLVTALHHEEAAIEVATWIARLYDAREQSRPGKDAPR